MDANGHRFWMLAEAGDFDLSDGSCQHSGDCLQLAGDIALPEQSATRAKAIAASNLPAVTVGHMRDWALFDPETPAGTEPGAILGTTDDGDLLPIMGIPAEAEIRDLWADAEGVLRIAGKTGSGTDGLIFIDMRGRWADPVHIETSGAQPDRGAGQWLMERSSGRLWREGGAQLADLAARTYADHIFRPDPEYANPVRLEEREPIALTSSERILDCAARSDGALAVLIAGAPTSKRSTIEIVPTRGERLRLDVPLAGFASSIGFIDDHRIALIYPGAKRVVVVELNDGDNPSLSVEPNRTPLILSDAARLCRGSVQPAHVVHFNTSNARPVAPPRALQALSMPSYRSTGEAHAAHPIHADSADTVWHRIVVEGDFPAGTGLAIDLQCADRTDELDAATIHTHYLGEIEKPVGAPQLAWLDSPSEIALHPGMLDAQITPQRSGCFSGLVQNSELASREVTGRTVRVTLRLFGTGQATPSIAAVRLYGSRFSLVRKYLPAVMQAPVDPQIRDIEGDAHPLDFLDRYVANFERVLTNMEDRVVAAPSLTDPMAAPSEALDWLSGWIGLTLKNGMSERQRRVMLANGMRLHRRRGTLPGLKLALDIASEGEVGTGGIVALEDFRLRRVFTTILGADLGSDFDPLLAGPVESGNSYVGNTLHLGDAAEIKDEKPVLSADQLTEIAALYRAPTDPDKADEVREFFAQLAWKLTVLVHSDVDEQRLALLRDVAAQMTPAHVQLKVERATRPLIVGLYSLLGVDSYLRARAGASPVITDETELGVRDQILALPSLDPAADYSGAEL